MDRLPEEILVRIFGDPEILCSGTLRELTRVSRKFSRIATPLFYSMLGLNGRPRLIKRFLSTLVANHNIRPLVQRIGIGLWELLDVGAHEVSGDGISIVELSNILHAVPSLASCPLKYQQEFGIGLLSFKRDAMFAALLSLLTNLKSLCVFLSPASPYDDEDTPAEDYSPLDLTHTLTIRLLELSSTPLLTGFPLFGHLSYICIKGNSRAGDNMVQWDPSLISILLRLPALKALTAFGCREDHNGAAWICDEGASGVTEVRLQYGQVGADTIRKVLRSCQALQDFNCSRSCQGCLHGQPTCDYSYADIHRDLYRHRKSLHTLRLNNQACNHSNQRNEEPITTLAALDNLKSLAVDEDVLFGYHDEHDENTRSIAGILPTGLQHIKICGDNEVSHIGTFCEMGRVILSHKGLQSVTFQSAYLADAEEVVKKLPGVVLEVMGPRYAHGYCTFRMYRVEAEEAECESSHEYGAEEQMTTC